MKVIEKLIAYFERLDRLKQHDPKAYESALNVVGFCAFVIGSFLTYVSMLIVFS